MNSTYIEDLFYDSDDNRASGVIRYTGYDVSIEPVSSTASVVLLDEEGVIAVIAAAKMLKTQSVDEIAKLLGLNQPTPVEVKFDDATDVALRKLTKDDIDMLYDLVSNKLDWMGNGVETNFVHSVFLKVADIREAMIKGV